MFGLYFRPGLSVTQQTLTICASEEFATRENVYLQALLEAGCLVLGVFGDGGVWAAALTRPRLPGAAVVPVLVGWLLDLSPHLHSVLCVGLHQTLSGEQTKVWQREKEGENIDVFALMRK